MKNKIKKLLMLLFTIFLISVVSAFTYSNPQYFPYSKPSEVNYDNSMCEAGQDFIIQVAPFGCTPAVVRSDLLEEQDVQVYCQLAATQLNPLIDVEAIESISFSGKYPKEISAIGFYPARAALGIGGKLNYPILENIGYVVLNLRRQINESAMPDFIEGNLTARIRYDIKKALGVGSAWFYLPEMNEEEWKKMYPAYGFWVGKGYVKAENIELDKATISIYDKELRRISTFTLKKGESYETSIPGFDFCQGSLNIKLDEIEAPDTRAKLKINADAVEVAEGEKFLDNKCQVKKIEKQGLIQKVRIYCREDDKPRTFELSLIPKIKLLIDGQEKEVGLGDFLYQVPGKNEYVYLGYIGTKGNEKLEDLFVYFVSLPEKKDITKEELSKIELFVELMVDNRMSDVEIIDTPEIFERVVGLSILASEFIKEGKKFHRLDYMKDREKVGAKKVFGKNVEIKSFAGVYDQELDENTLKYFNDANKDFSTILESYSEEKYPENAQTVLGEEALYQQIVLLNKLSQKKTMTDLCEEFKERYPNSEKNVDFCDNGYKISNSGISTRIVTIDGKDREISFEDIYEPTYDDYGAEIWIRGPEKTEQFRFRKNQLIELSGFRDLEEKEPYEYVQLISLEEDSAIIKVNLVGGVEKYSVSDEKTLKKDIPEKIGDYTFILKNVNLKKFAKVSLIPNINNVGTEANFSFKIGIEKRGIKLSPDKIKEKIENLNSSIKKWEDISDNLGKIITLEKTACLVTGTALTLKNLIQSLKGKGIARQLVMRGKGGWYEKCIDMVNSGTYVSQEKCLLDKSSDIDKDVENYYKILNEQNEKIKELQEQFTEKKILAESVVNTDEFMEKYSVQVQDELNILGNIFEDPEGKQESIDVNKIKETLTYEAWKNNIYDLEELREIEFYTMALEKNPQDERAKKRLYSLLYGVKTASGNFVERTSLQSDINNAGFNIQVSSYGDEKAIKGIYGEGTVLGSKFSEIWEGKDDNINYPTEIITYQGKKYILILQALRGNEYFVDRAYEYKGISGGKIQVGEEKTELIREKFSVFRKYDKKTYENPFKPGTAEVRYFETEPYKGFPAVVPFDLYNGWYAATKQVLPMGKNIATFDASARVNSFWLCNVGENGIEEFYSGFGDDSCAGINLGTGQPYDQFPGLSEQEASKMVGCAVDALEQASRAYEPGVSKVKITTRCGNFNVKVGKPALDIPDIQCQDFMSPKECNLIFNVCDPVICPSSRCDFGGAYPVRDVIQTGIVGGLLLCLPNFREGIVIPVCLTGIKAGMDNFISVQKSYRDCLQNNLETGKMVGICDEVYSVYLCEFFWRQALPLAKIAIPKITEFLLGQNVRGGGEYLSVKNAFETAKGSVDYFTQYYGAESFKAFKARTTEEIGTVVCRDFASMVVPKSADLFDKLIEPDSPAQFTGRFDEIPFTTVTVPPISHYKVFYHIYAGKNTGAYYRVYLKGIPETSYYQDVSLTLPIASGYIPVGGYATETIDKTAPSGYKQLCINVNGQEECGFKEVSTSFAVDYIKDQYLAEQASAVDITTEEECISGSASLYNLLIPNIQSSAETLINPEIYNQGIIRICATENPGLGSDPYVGTKSSRWVEVGYCGNEKIKCWLDTKSVSEIISSPNVTKFITEGKIESIESGVLDEVTTSYLEILTKREGYLSREEFDSAVKEIEKESSEEKINSINKIIDKVFYNNHKAYLLLLRGKAYGDLALKEFWRFLKEKEKAFEIPEEEEIVTKEGEEVTKEIKIPLSCQKEIGNRILEIAKEEKEKYNIDDEIVEKDTGAKNFECLVLQVAMQESSLNHCDKYKEGSCFECKTGFFRKRVEKNAESRGVMQINIIAHKNELKNEGIDITRFEENVKFGIRLLNRYYDEGAKQYSCNGKIYSGWKRSLRRYNGWNIDCSKGNINYVEDVLKRKEQIAKMFPECA